jgi:hypothetical protein
MNLTCEQTRMLYIALAAAGAGAGGYYWKKTTGGVGGAAVGGILAYLLLAACGPDTTGPTLAPTPDGTKKTVVAPRGGPAVIAGRKNTAGPQSARANVAASLTKATQSLVDMVKAPVGAQKSTATAAGMSRCPTGWAWSDSRGRCVYQTNVK